jgi:hypothetical protein
VNNEYAVFEGYSSYIKDLPNFSKQSLFQPQFRLDSVGAMDIYYAPFDYVNRDARVTVIGITPGFTQMEIAYREAQRGLGADLPVDVVLRNIKQAASFAGSMRANLLAMLDELGVHEHLGLHSPADLFQGGFKYLHTTSVVRYPVFVNGKNHTGQSPRIVRSPLLQRYALELFGSDLEALADTLIIPLGKSVEEAVRFVCAKKSLSLPYCLWNFPHPSGANGHRKPQFNEYRDDFKEIIERWGD